MLSIGLISDTHGLLRPEARFALQGSDMILHAGDVGSPDVLDGLRSIAPTIAVRGNVDREGWARKLPLTEVVNAGGILLYLLHDLSQLDLDPKAAGFSAVIYGHSHRADAEMRDGVLYLNPGSAGRRRFDLPVTVAELLVDGGRINYNIKPLVP
jgi:uncharacterized protein